MTANDALEELVRAVAELQTRVRAIEGWPADMINAASASKLPTLLSNSSSAGEPPFVGSEVALAVGTSPPPAPGP